MSHRPFRLMLWLLLAVSPILASSLVDELLARIAKGEMSPVIDELGKLGSEAKPAVPALKKILRTETAQDWKVWAAVRDAAKAIGRIDSSDHESFLLVKGAVSGKSIEDAGMRDQVPEAGLHGLGEFKPFLAEAIPVFVHALADSRIGVRMAAQDELTRADFPAVPAVVQALADLGEAEGAASVLSYLSFHSKEKVQLVKELSARQAELIRALQSPNQRVRQDVANALRLVQTPEAQAAMKSQQAHAADLAKQEAQERKRKKERQYGSIQQVDLPELVKEDCDHPAYVNFLEYANLTGGQGQQAVLVASTCNTGTAGPDVHAVFTLDPSRRVQELMIEDPPVKNLAALFGSRNYELKVADGVLVAVYTDTSGREDALTVRYSWNGKRFAPGSVTQDGPYKTSYDCANATNEVERAICYSESVAKRDVQLAEAYRKSLAATNREGQDSLKRSQREWIKKRDQSCPVYKWWVECLEKSYDERIQAVAAPASPKR